MKSSDIAAPREEILGAPASTWDRDDFQQRVQPLLPQLYRLCVALSDDTASAEDLLQTSLIKAYTHRASYRGSAPFLGWLYAIVRNEQMESIRTTARRRGLVQAAVERFGQLFEEWGTAPEADPESWLLSGESSGELLAAVRELPEGFRVVVWMCDVEELGYDEVASTLGIPIGTVKSRHARGRARLRALLDGAEQASEVKR